MKKSNLALGVEGFLLIVLGLIVIAFPGYTTLSVIFFTGWLFLLLGASLFIFGLKLPSDTQIKPLYILEGLMLFLLGALFVFGNPMVTTVVMIYALIFWFIANAILGVFFASRCLSTGGKIANVIINLIVIVVAVMAIFDPALASSLFILTLAYNFMFAGISRLVLMDFS